MSLPLRPDHVAPDHLDLPFWEACARGEFLVHVCGDCGRAYWPSSCCIDHGAAPMRWVPASGRGEVHTYTVFHHAYDPRFADRVPYVIAVVLLDEGPFFHADVVGCAPEDVHVGLRVEAEFETVGDGIGVPHFRPAGA